MFYLTLTLETKGLIVVLAVFIMVMLLLSHFVPGTKCDFVELFYRRAAVLVGFLKDLIEYGYHDGSNKTTGKAIVI